MCGFVGYVGRPCSVAAVADARDLLRHRGPDASGLWEDTFPGGSVSMGFRRLRILDLSAAADQPMSLGPLRLVYNGEIYNFRDLRSELEGLGHRFRSSGDTEVLLAAVRQWGVGAVERLEGMFALAVWDAARNQLMLARDRLGIKPLYYATHRQRFVFASEPKAVLRLAEMDAAIDEVALERFLTFLWVPDPDTLFAGVRKLPPGHVLVSAAGETKLVRYWDARPAPVERSADEHVEVVRSALRESVRRQMVSDVPLGVFLSGGIDSTLVAALAAREATQPVVAIASGFEQRTHRNELGADDLAYARLAAARLPAIDYQEVLVTEPSAELARDLVGSFDDPVADPMAISTYLISRAAKGRATVMLSGMGAEELFGGYPRHRALAWATRVGRFPSPVRGLIARVGGLVPGARPGRGMGALRHARAFMRGASESEPYLAFCAHQDGVSLARLLGRPVDWESVSEVHRAHLERATDLPVLSRALYLDLKTFLPCLNLACTDKASMAASVEVRVPILDERVVAAALQVPDNLKVKGRVGKVVLRKAAEGTVAQEILTRPKTGFGAPVRTWMREFSADVIRDCLSPTAIRRRGLVEVSAVEAMRGDLVSGRSDQALQLWSLVTLELWARRFLDN